MQELRDLVEGPLAFLVERGYAVGEIEPNDRGGNIVFAKESLVMQAVHERGETSLRIRPSDTSDWFWIGVVRRLLTGERPRSDSLDGEALKFLQDRLSEIERKSGAGEQAAFVAALQAEREARATEMFGGPVIESTVEPDMISPSDHLYGAPPKRRMVASDSREGEVLANGTVIVYDLYDWLSDSGEDDVAFEETDDNLLLTITEGDQKLFLVFHGAVFHVRSTFPGRSPISGTDSTGVGLACLADLAISPYRDEWVADTTKPGSEQLRHYWAMFNQAGVVVQVLAESVSIRGLL